MYSYSSMRYRIYYYKTIKIPSPSRAYHVKDVGGVNGKKRDLSLNWLEIVGKFINRTVMIVTSVEDSLQNRIVLVRP